MMDFISRQQSSVASRQTSVIVGIDLVLALFFPTAGASQQRDLSTLRDPVQATVSIPRQSLPSDSISATVDRPRVYRTPEELKNEQIAEMIEQIADLKNSNKQLRLDLTLLRSEMDTVKVSNRAPPGYTQAFTTKFNWDSLEDNVGIRYFAPYKNK